MRDYSGKIRYGKENQNINSYSAVNENKVDIVRDGDTTSKVVKSADNADTFKHNSSIVSDVIKGESISENRTESKTYTSDKNYNSKSRSIPVRNYNIVSENIINDYTDNAYSGIIKENNSDIIKNNGSSEIVKPKNNEGVFRHNYDIANEVVKNRNTAISEKPKETKENKAYIHQKNKNFKNVPAENKPYISEKNLEDKAFDYKENSAYDVVKSENKKTESVIKSFDKRLIKDNVRSVVKDTNANDKTFVSDNSDKTNIIADDKKSKAFKYSEEKSEISTIKDNTVIFDEKQLKVDILPKDQNSAFSYSIKEYLSDKTDFKDNNRSKLSEIAHKNTIKKMSEKPVNADSEKNQAFKYSEEETEIVTSKNDTVIIEEKRLRVDILPKEQNSAFSYSIKEYLSDKTDFKNNNRSKLSEIAHKDIIKNMSEKNKAFKYADNNSKTAQNIKQDFSYNSILKSENSKDKALKSTVISMTAVEILKPEKTETPPKITRGNKRKTVYNKSQIMQKAKNLNIKSELKNQFRGIVKQANSSAKKAIKVGGSSIMKSIKSEIEQAGENDLAFKAVDDVIKTTDKAMTAKRGAKAAINTGSKAAKGIIGTGKAIKNTPSNIKSAAKNFKEKIRKRQKKKALKKVHQKKLVKKAAKKIAESTVSALSAIATKLFIMFLPLFIVIIICAAVVVIISSITWQTGTDLDTTQIIKYVAELDYNQQNNWYSKGKTNVDIERQNDNSSKSYNYHYLLAADVPNDDNLSANPSDGEVNCLITLSKISDGSERKPTYKGFNMEFSSCDEMLELYRWTTDDYRAMLAYLQVKNENLGWFASLVGFVGEYQLKSCAKELHQLTYNHKIVIKNTEPGKDPKYNFETPIYSTTYTNNSSHDYYYFGRKYSVNYIIENDMIRFDSDDKENASMKEQYEYVYKYGNIAVGNLIFPLELQTDEVISDRIAKHFGKQIALEYTPPEKPEDKHTDVYGSVSNKTAYHYAVDLSADEGDIIYSPIKGLCKAKQREKRGFEYTICTSYNGNNFDFTKDGYLIKISCSKASYIPTASSKVVRQGDKLGIVGGNMEVNYKIPDTANDTENEDIFADKLFPCSTFTNYHNIGKNEFDIPENTQDYIHLEMYKLPCDFSDKADIEENVLNPELFFDFSKEAD